MSSVSQKTGLSPSITKEGSDGGIDMGGKTTPSVTSGGEIGVTREITNIGGVSVTGGVSVDLSPIDLGINYDSSENSVSVAAGAEVPGGLLGVAGGVTIDLDTGQVTGVTVGAEGLGVGVNISISEDGSVGVGITLQIPFTPIKLELGLGFPQKGGRKNPAPTPTPTPTPKIPTSKKCLTGDWVVGGFGRAFNGDDYEPVARFYEGQEFIEKILLFGLKVRTYNEASGLNVEQLKDPDKSLEENATKAYPFGWNETIRNYEGYFPSGISNDIWYSNVGNWYFRHRDGSLFVDRRTEKNSDQPLKAIKAKWRFKRRNLCDVRKQDWWIGGCAIGVGFDYSAYIEEIVPPPPCPGGDPKPETETPPNTSNFSPFPHPPPRRNMDPCCAESIKLQRLIARHLGAIRSFGQESLPEGVKEIGSTQDGIRQAFPFVAKKRWIDPNAKEDEVFPVLNDRQLTFVLGGMIERLERTLGTAEFYKDSDKKLRQSEGNLLSWLTGKNKDFKFPDPNDFWVNSDDGIINEKTLEVRSIADGLRYQIEALNRLERILPIAELKDSSIPKRWIYPGAKGQERVGNLIHLIELMVRSDDKHRGYWPVKVKVKNADPAIKGDEPVELEFHSQADVFRELFQFLIDMEGDGDMSSNFLLRMAFQMCQMHQLTVKNNAMLDATVEYLDFKVKNSTANVPMPFNPFAGISPSLIDQALEKLGIVDGMPLNPSIDSNKESDIEALAPNVLQNTTVKVDIVECDESKTLNDSLLELLKHASASSAAVSERVSEPAIDRVIEGAKLAQQLTSFLRRRDVAGALGIGDLDKWINSAELGYTDKPESESLRFPESDPLQPYNRPTTQNPKIKEIDTKEPQAD